MARAIMGFEEWLEYVFGLTDRERRALNERGEFDLFPAQEATHRKALLEYLARLFESPVPQLDRFSDDQLACGFWYMLNTGSDYQFAAIHGAENEPELIRVVRAIPNLCREVFARRCTQSLCHLNEGSKLDGSVYLMWEWGFCAACRFDHPTVFNRESIAALKSILAIEQSICQESALIGLGWSPCHEEDECAGIIKEWLASNPHARPELRTFAMREMELLLRA